MKVLITVLLNIERTPWNKGNEQTELIFRNSSPVLTREVAEGLVLNSSKASSSGFIFHRGKT